MLTQISFQHSHPKYHVLLVGDFPLHELRHKEHKMNTQNTSLISVLLFQPLHHLHSDKQFIHFISWLQVTQQSHGQPPYKTGLAVKLQLCIDTEWHKIKINKSYMFP